MKLSNMEIFKNREIYFRRKKDNKAIDYGISKNELQIHFVQIFFLNLLGV